jgi:chromosomal replication initiation ATPase DnaA
MDRLAAIEERLGKLELAIAGLSRSKRRLVKAQPIAAIAIDAADLLGLALEDILDGPQTAENAEAMRAISWVARQAGFGPTRIGRALGRDHSTISQHARHAERERHIDLRFQILTDRLLTSANARRTVQ